MHQAGHSVSILFNDNSYTMEKYISCKIPGNRRTSNPPEQVLSRERQQVLSPPVIEPIDLDTEMEDSITLRAPVSSPQNTTHNRFMNVVCRPFLFAICHSGDCFHYRVPGNTICDKQRVFFLVGPLPASLTEFLEVFLRI